MTEKLRLVLVFLIIFTVLTIVTLYIPSDHHIGQYLTDKIRPYLKEKLFLNYPNNAIQRRDKLLLKNPFYKRFNLTAAVKKTYVTLLLIVSSAPKRYDRRMSIRRTWWQECRSKYKKSVECIFMTDNVTKTNEYYDVIKNESMTYNDIRLQNLEGGVVFGHRMIYHMIYAMLNYQFDYFLRMDDDYFLCIDKLIYELPKSPMPRFHWGWVHRDVPKNTRRPEESMILLSNDVISSFILQDYYSLYCHPWADQMIIVWSHKLGLNNIYRHDERLHHTPIYADSTDLKFNKEICRSYMGIHGVYPPDMEYLWHNRGNRTDYEGTLFDNSIPIDMPEDFCWSCFIRDWRYEPKLCMEDYHWDTSHQGRGSYGGRQDGHEK